MKWWFFCLSLGVVSAEESDGFREEMLLSTPKSVAAGMEKFKKLCASCHGETGDGNTPVAKVLKPPPRNMLDPELKWKMGKEPLELYQTIVNGIPGTAMAPVGASLPEKERWELVHFIGTLKGVKGKYKPITKKNLKSFVADYRKLKKTK